MKREGIRGGMIKRRALSIRNPELQYFYYEFLSVVGFVCRTWRGGNPSQQYKPSCVVVVIVIVLSFVH